MKFISCHECGKKLLKIGIFDQLSIKCSRCKTLNHLSVQNTLSEDHESQYKRGKTREQHSTKTLLKSPNSVCRTKT
ncbi:Com family DNA-binding transcriptional regulator [Psychrobacter pygoscelis]|uniref:Com family DNA-binding transcriptional regulator n=1 Tax=Psychrobacter pygoscelis TaxID=2488563 RepID=UPI00103EE870